MPTDHSSLGALHRVAVHIVARARIQATGRFSLRVTAGGFGTPEFGEAARRVRVSGASLIVESDRSGDAWIRSVPIAGSSMRALAAHAQIDLDRALDVGHDTPAVGDVDAPIALDGRGADDACAWFACAADALDRVVLALPAQAAPTLPRLWPEHFDLAVEAVAPSGVRVNLGASPGDSFCGEPYVYVGPWTDDRPGGSAFWNAPFGAFVPASALGDPAASAAAAFLLDGFRRLG